MKKILSLLLLIPIFSFGQIEVKYFNAAWNSANDVDWFMSLEDPTLEQSGLISIIVGAGAAWFGLYAGTDKDKSKD